MTHHGISVRTILLLGGASLALAACVVEPWPGYYYYPRYAYAPSPPPPASAAPSDRTVSPVTESNCREFHGDAVIDGKTQSLTGTACRQADGQWRVVR